MNQRFEYLSAQGLLLAFILWMRAYRRVHVTEIGDSEDISWTKIQELVNEFLVSANDAGERFF